MRYDMHVSQVLRWNKSYDTHRECLRVGNMVQSVYVKQNNVADPHRRTSDYLQCKVYPMAVRTMNPSQQSHGSRATVSPHTTFRSRSSSLRLTAVASASPSQPHPPHCRCLSPSGWSTIPTESDGSCPHIATHDLSITILQPNTNGSSPSLFTAASTALRLSFESN